MKGAREGYEFRFDDAQSMTILAEDAAYSHGVLELVDLVVELPDRYIFVEVVGAPKTEEGRGALKAEHLCETLARKYRDSIFFHAFGERAPKTVEYAVLLALEEIDDILIAMLQDELKRRIPLSHPKWRTDSAESCWIMSEVQWKRRYGGASVRRVTR